MDNEQLDKAILDLIYDIQEQVAEMRKMALQALEKQKKGRFNKNNLSWLTAQQAQRMLNVSRTTLFKYRKARLIKTKPFNTHYRYNYEDVQRILNNENPVFIRRHK